MSELHWTGAALLRALAVLGRRSLRALREPTRRRANFAPWANGQSTGPPTREEAGGCVMKNAPGYEGDLDDFRDLPVGVNVAHLRFLRWLIEQGRLEHPAAGPPAGMYARATRR